MTLMDLNKMSNDLESKSNLLAINPFDLKEIAEFGLLSVRGDLGSKRLSEALKFSTGLKVPTVRSFVNKSKVEAFWMSTDELLIKAPGKAIDGIESKMLKGLKDFHSSVVNISDSRSLFTIKGALCRDILGKLCPVDFDKKIFKIGDFRRTRMAQVPVALSLLEDNYFQIMCYRSVKEYVYNILKMSGCDNSNVNFY